ncbi:MAG TPA: SDR family oxidoreductase [Acidimicrobiia bacterium]|nr:SDR family oxidoreductase [Acidimicrobiia bacterium]
MSGTVVVTGAARGIGRAIGERLQDAGFTVVGVDVGDGLAETSFEPVQVDITDPAGIEAVVDTVVGLGEPPVALVNNAGITRDARLVNLTEADVAAVLEVNLGAAFHLSEALAGRLADGGSIVNLASRAYLGNFGQFNYSMSKGGVVGLTRALALQLAPSVRVNAIAPGLIATEMSLAIPEEIRKKMVDNIPLGRMGEPSEVADLVAWLLEPGYITGHVFVIGGGRSLA